MPRRHMNISYVLSAQEHRSRRLDHAHTCGIRVPITIPLAGTRHAKLRQQRVKRLDRYRNAGPVMPELQDIDIAHFPHIRFEFIPLGITGQQNAKAPACPLIGNIQHRRIRVLVATNPGIRPNKLTDEGADPHRIALAQLAHGGAHRTIPPEYGPPHRPQRTADRPAHPREHREGRPNGPYPNA